MRQLSIVSFNAIGSLRERGLGCPHALWNGGHFKARFSKINMDIFKWIPVTWIWRYLAFYGLPVTGRESMESCKRNPILDFPIKDVTEGS